MASKHSNHNADVAVNERRLRPIYDRLDNGNNKKAIQEADKVLKKHPDNQCAKVLKALALLRLGKEDECQLIIDKVRSEVPCEDSTLQAISICYREIQQPDKISEVYEAALKANPHNEELLTHLFMSYVRQGDFKKQQHTALALYKLIPNNPYYFWAVMSLVMQANQTSEIKAKNLVLSLAERMVLKFVDENRVEAEEEIQLYLMILELQGKMQEIYNVLSGPLGSKLTSLSQKKAKLLLQMKRYEEAKSAYEILIPNDLDNWAFYMAYLTAALECQSATESYLFIDQMLNLNYNRKVRAPQLARFELLKRAAEQNLHIKECPSTTVLMRQYFTQFGTKDCVISDLRLYIHLLQKKERNDLIQAIELDIGFTEDSFPSDVSQMQRHIHLEQLKRLCGWHHAPIADSEERQRLVRRYSDLYERGRVICPAGNKLRSDFCLSDAYLLLACHILHQLWEETSQASWLYKAMELLERGIDWSPANFQMKMLLIKTYLEAGLVNGAECAYTSLECKHIQLDSLGYLHNTYLASLGYLTQASNMLDLTSKFFVSNYKDSADHLNFAYKYGSFSKIQEFMELRERLENSIHFATVTVDKMLLEISSCGSCQSLLNSLSAMHIQPQNDTIKWDLLRDNRDVEAVENWEPFPKDGQDIRMREETCECMIQLLKARSLILRILAAANDSQPSAVIQDLATKLCEFNQEQIPITLKKFGDSGRITVNKVIVSVDAVERLNEAFNSQQLSLIGRFANSLAASMSPDAECIEMLKTAPSLQIPTLPNSNEPISYKNILFRISTCGETLALLSAISSLFLWHQGSNVSRKKNKKKNNKEPVTNACNNSSNDPDNWTDMTELFQEKISQLEIVLQKLESLPILTGLDEGEDSATVNNHARVSLSTSCSNVKSRLLNTQKLVQGLKSR